MFYSKRVATIERRIGRTEEKIAGLSQAVSDIGENIDYIRLKLDSRPIPVTWPVFMGILTLLSGVALGILKLFPSMATLIARG